MSQKKVDYYKEQKKNRAEIMRKEKRNRQLGLMLTVLVAAAMVAWFGYLFVQNARMKAASTVQAMELDVEDTDNFLNSIDSLIHGEETEETAEAGE